jgi:hypothetical protein
MLFDMRKTLALPPTFAEQWRQALDAWRGPPSFAEQWRHVARPAFDVPAIE